MNILLVEDELNVLSFIRRGLEEEGHVITIAPDGLTGEAILENGRFDLVILDIMLPGKSGLEICRNLRAQGKTVPVIMLTALGSTENVVHGLDSGADDYLVKPFKFDELNARIRSVTRRKSNEPARNLPGIADLTLDTVEKTASRGGEKITLTATEYRLLEYMLRNQRMVLSRADILENVWDVNYNMGTNVVDVYVNYLRKKIDRQGSPRLIHTVIGMGYIMKEES